MEKTFNFFTPATLMRWHRELVRRKWDYSKLIKKPGQPRIDRELEELTVRLALENPSDGYQSLAGRLRLLGFDANPETVQNILEADFKIISVQTHQPQVYGSWFWSPLFRKNRGKRNGISPSPERQGRLTWREFLDMHCEDLAATDFEADLNRNQRPAPLTTS